MLPGCQRRTPPFGCTRGIVGMDHRRPAIAVKRPFGEPAIIIDALIEPIEQAIGLRRPDLVGHRLGEGAELGLARRQRRFGLVLRGDIRVGAEPPHDPIVLILERCDPR